MIGFFEHQYLSFKKRHIKNLVALANSDGHMHEDEKALIFKLGEKYGLKERQVRMIIDSKKEHKLYVPEKDEEKMDQLFDLLQMVYADGVVDDNEVVFCKDVVSKFGYKEKLVGKLIDLFEKDGPAPADWDNVKLELIKLYS